MLASRTPNAPTADTTANRTLTAPNQRANSPLRSETNPVTPTTTSRPNRMPAWVNWDSVK